MEFAGIPANRRYAQNDGNTAIWDFLKFLDANNDKIITAAEAGDLIVKVCGYSWGGVSAVGFTQKLSQIGTIVVAGSPHDPIAYSNEVNHDTMPWYVNPDAISLLQ